MNLEHLRAFCLTLPGTTEDVKWEDHLCFCVGGKMYYITSFTHPTSSLKVADEEFNEITGREGIIPAPYLARNKWVQVASFDTLDRKEWEHYIRQSYELVKSKLPKKLQMEIDAGNIKTPPAQKKNIVKKTGAAKPLKKAAAKKKTAVKKKAAGRKKK